MFYNILDFIEWYSKHNLIFSVRDINYDTGRVDVVETNKTKSILNFNPRDNLRA